MNKRELGKIGEEIAEKFLENNDVLIILYKMFLFLLE